MRRTRRHLGVAFATASAFVIAFFSPAAVSAAHDAGSDAGSERAPARQAGGWERCPNGSLCLFDGRDGTGTMAWFRLGSPDLRRQSMDNRASSVWNRHADAFQLADDYHHEGACWSVFPGARANLDAFDDRASSVRLYACG